MHLTKLEIQGFKSFPEYTVIDFDKGLTAVVGPNGSGKSNVIDAIRWVLGEQSVKSLRGGKMEDVIFNGTSSRKPMNYAEVSITLDNTDHFIDSEFLELHVTRRLYRSGESEYQINRANCRLKDIRDLLLDTGLGKDGYSIIGQGRVEEILSTKSEDRRKVIEEAAGIVKYKVRKEEAERKLNSTTDNLERIDDILIEISERLEPLKKQSEDAILYHKKYEELKTNDISYLVTKIEDANSQIGSSSDTKEQLEKEIKEQEDLYLSIRSENKDLSDSAMELEETIEEQRQLLSDISEKIHEDSSLQKIYIERGSGYREKLQELNEDINLLVNEVNRLKEEEIEKDQEADSLLNEANSLKVKADSLVNEKNQLLEQISEFSMSSEKIKKDMDSRSSELETALRCIAANSTQLEGIDSRIVEVNSDINTNEALLKELSNKIESIDANWKDMMEKEGQVTSDIESYKDIGKKLKDEANTLLANHENKNRKYLSEKTRLSTLKELLERKEGYSESTRKLINEIENSSYSGMVFGIIGDLISTDKKYELAIEVALGSSIHNIVTRTEDEAAELISLLKQKRLGRVTFLPIENITSKDIDGRILDKASKDKGFIGIANELVSFPKDISEIIGSLLGRIIVCDNIDSGRRIARSISYQTKIITLEGDSINPGGSLTGGSYHRNNAGILGRSREIEEISINLEKLVQEISIIEAQRQELDEKEQDNIRNLAMLDEQLKYYSIERAKAESDYKNLQDKLNDVNESIASSRNTLKELSNNKIVISNDLEEYQTIVREAKADLSDYMEVINASNDKYSAVKDKVDTINDSISHSSSEADRILTMRNGILDLKNRIVGDIKAREQNLQSKKTEIETITNSLNEINNDIENTALKVENSKKQYSEIEIKVKELFEKKSEIDSRLSGFMNRLTDASDRINDLRNKYNTLVMKYEKFFDEIDASKNRLWEDYETTYDNIKDKYTRVNNIQETTKLITKLKNEIKAIGPVNLNSIEEYKEISTRHDFLTSQKEDILLAKKDLEKIITDLTNEMQKQFSEEFVKINTNFNKVFVDLFGGGTAEIILENENDVLNSNIDIKAQPPGKRLQSISLLSGGEKSITAIALLFAILELSPSPFVILDEVDAALDDVNINRFTGFVKRHVVNSQFILVTHRKGTMEECDRMYGVTMQERGISKILSMRIQ